MLLSQPADTPNNVPLIDPKPQSLTASLNFRTGLPRDASYPQLRHHAFGASVLNVDSKDRFAIRKG